MISLKNLPCLFHDTQEKNINQEREKKMSTTQQATPLPEKKNRMQLSIHIRSLSRVATTEKEKRKMHYIKQKQLLAGSAKRFSSNFSPSPSHHCCHSPKLLENTRRTKETN